MAENKDPEKAPASITEKFKMEPPSGAWNALDADLERRSAALYRRKANHFRTLSIGLALLLISFISFYYLGTPEKPKASVSVTEKPKQVEHVNQTNVEDHNQPEIKSKATANNDIAGENHDQKRAKPLGNSSVNTFLANENEKKAAITSKQLQASKVNPPSKTENKVSVNNAQSNSDVSDKKATISQINISEAGVTPVSAQTTIADEKQNAVPANLDQKINNNTDKGAIVLIESSTSQNVSENKTISNESGSNEVQQNNSPAVTNEVVPPVKPATEGTTTSTQMNHPSTDSVSGKENALKSRWSISAFYSPHYSRNRLTDNNSNDAENPADYNSHEKSLYSFSTGIELWYHFSDRWSIASGAAYSTMSYSITIPTIYAYNGSDNTVHYQYPTSCGIIEMPNNYGKTLNNGDTIKVNSGCDQILRFIKIPLLARFDIPMNAFSFYTKAGISANILIQEKSNVHIWNKEIEIVNNIEGLSKVSYSAMLGFGVEYRVYKHIGIFIEPVYTTAITSLTHDISLNCYPYSFGLNMGASWHF